MPAVPGARSLRVTCLAVFALAGSACDTHLREDLEAHDARIAALEEQVGRLESSMNGTMALLGEPPDAAWVLVGTEEWATNGHVMVRRDGPRPNLGAVRQSWQLGMTAEQFSGVLVGPASTVSLTRIDTANDGGTALDRYQRMPDGADVYIDGAYAPLLSAGRAVQGPEALDPLYVLADDGSILAVVMPRTPPAGL